MAAKTQGLPQRVADLEKSNARLSATVEALQTTVAALEQRLDKLESPRDLRCRSLTVVNAKGEETAQFKSSGLLWAKAVDVSAERGVRGLSLNGKQGLLQAFELRVVSPSDGKVRVRVRAQTGDGKVQVSSRDSKSLAELYAGGSSSGLNLSGASGRMTARVAASPEGGRSELKADESRSRAAVTSRFDSSRRGSLTVQDGAGAVTSRLG